MARTIHHRPHHAPTAQPHPGLLHAHLPHLQTHAPPALRVQPLDRLLRVANSMLRAVSSSRPAVACKVSSAKIAEEAASTQLVASHLASEQRRGNDRAGWRSSCQELPALVEKPWLGTADPRDSVGASRFPPVARG